MAIIINGLPEYDGVATLGLNGTHDSLAYRTAEIERHVHGFERWFELAATPAGETHRADRAGTGAGVFQIDAGNLDWGSWLQILGSDDTPVLAGSAYFDPHRIEITATERSAIYVIQIAFGETAAAGLAAGMYIEFPIAPASNLVDAGPVDLQSRRVAAGTKAWARCICPGQNTATLDFMFGIHEYEG